jgi:hypothetical protein
MNIKHSGNGPQFEYCWIRAKKNSMSVQVAIEVMGEDRAKDLAAIWWRYGIASESGQLLLNPDGSDYEDHDETSESL